MTAHGLKAGSHCARVLEVLADGREHSFHEIHERAGFMRLNSRVAELRKYGHTIDCRRDGNDYLYTLASSPKPEPEKTVANRIADSPPGSGSEGEPERTRGSADHEQLALEAA